MQAETPSTLGRKDQERVPGTGRLTARTEQGCLRDYYAAPRATYRHNKCNNTTELKIERKDDEEGRKEDRTKDEMFNAAPGRGPGLRAHSSGTPSTKTYCEQHLLEGVTFSWGFPSLAGHPGGLAALTPILLMELQHGTGTQSDLFNKPVVQKSTTFLL